MMSPTWLSRILMQRANEAQWEKARETKRPEDYEKAREGRKALHVFEVIRNLSHLGR